jgi:hypothetical protein
MPHIRVCRRDMQFAGHKVEDLRENWPGGLGAGGYCENVSRVGISCKFRALKSSSGSNFQ